MLWGRQVAIGPHHLLDVVIDRDDLLTTSDRMKPDLMTAKEQ
jgi:hypothetical protein